MGNIVINSQFRPFSYEELARPLVMSTQAHNQIEDAYGALAEKANVWEKLASDERDKNSVAYQNYLKYSNELEKLSNELASKGLNNNSRQSAIDMKTRYSKDIIPIEEAYNQRAKIAEEQRKLQATNPDIMYSRDFSNVGIDELIQNPTLGYNTVKGNDIYNKGKGAAIAFSNRIHKGPMASKILDNMYWNLKEISGVSARKAAKFLLDQNSIPELKNTMVNLLKEAGVSNLNDADQERAAKYALDGIMAGLSYKETNKQLLDPYAKWKREQGGQPKEESNLNKSYRFVQGGLNYSKDEVERLNKLSSILKESKEYVDKIPKEYKQHSINKWAEIMKYPDKADEVGKKTLKLIKEYGITLKDLNNYDYDNPYNGVKNTIISNFMVKPDRIDKLFTYEGNNKKVFDYVKNINFKNYEDLQSKLEQEQYFATTALNVPVFNISGDNMKPLERIQSNINNRYATSEDDVKTNITAYIDGENKTLEAGEYNKIFEDIRKGKNYTIGITPDKLGKSSISREPTFTLVSSYNDGEPIALKIPISDVFGENVKIQGYPINMYIKTIKDNSRNILNLEKEIIKQSEDKDNIDEEKLGLLQYKIARLKQNQDNLLSNVFNTLQYTLNNNLQEKTRTTSKPFG